MIKPQIATIVVWFSHFFLSNEKLKKDELPIWMWNWSSLVFTWNLALCTEYSLYDKLLVVFLALDKDIKKKKHLLKQM